MHIQAPASPVRLDVFLTEACPAYSRAQVQRLIKQGLVCVQGSGELLSNPARKTLVGEVYEVGELPAQVSTLVAQDIPLKILFEDQHLIVLNKPPGLTVHPAAGHADGTLVNALLHHVGAFEAGEAGRPGIVHRLDKDTSGVMVVAKTDFCLQRLAKQFATRTAGRVYTALCWGVPMPLVGEIEGNIGRHPSHRQKMAVLEKGGKPAHTHYKVQKIFCGDAVSQVELKLKSGRTHQIRVHMAHKGHGVVGDATYGKPPILAVKKLPVAIAQKIQQVGRQMLHAHTLTFTHPVSSERLIFSAQPPYDMQDLINMLTQG